MRPEERRREPRFSVNNPQLVDITIQQPDGRVSQSINAELQDLSQGGARLLLSAPLLYDESADLAFRSTDLKLDLIVSADVCWMRPLEHGQWMLGCSFVPELPLGVLEKLFAGDILERRSAKRELHRLPVTAVWEAPPATMPAYVWDYSTGGFCLLSPCRAGRQVSVAAEPEPESPSVRGQTKWELEMAGGYVAGCRFVDSDGFQQMQDLKVEEPPIAPEGERRTSVLQAFRGMVGSFLQRPW